MTTKKNSIIKIPIERPCGVIWVINYDRKYQTETLAQMLDELKRGGIYMKMDHPASKRK